MGGAGSAIKDEEATTTKSRKRGVFVIVALLKTPALDGET
jgi:hypothetical protein